MSMRGAPTALNSRKRRGPMPASGIVNLAARGMVVVSVARRLGSEGPLLAYCAAPALTERGRKKALSVR